MNSQPVVWKLVQPWLATHPSQGRCCAYSLGSPGPEEQASLCLYMNLRGLLLRRLEGALCLLPLFSPRGVPAFVLAPGSHGTTSPLAGPGDATQAEHHQAECRFPVS